MLPVRWGDAWVPQVAFRVGFRRRMGRPAGPAAGYGGDERGSFRQGVEEHFGRGIDLSQQQRSLPPPHQWPPNVLPGEYQIGHPVPPYACYFENALEMLDEPGEWHLDRQTGVCRIGPGPVRI
jgi:hypothetical protein